MKDKFIGYYKPSEKDFERMWKEGLFIFDTNVLLDFYRYSDDTVKELFKTFSLIKDRIWLPYQVAQEYHSNLIKIISEQVKKYDESLKTLQTFKEQIEEKRNHPFLDATLENEVREFYEKFQAILNSKKEEIKDLILSNPIKDKIAEIFNGKVGERFSDEELLKIYEEGKERYQRKIPPGYMDDKTKSEPDKYGDLVIWKEILRKNKEVNIPIIFITRDTKEDWFLKKMGLTVSPRPELFEEFCKVNNNLFYIYPTSSFLEYANEYLGAEIDKKSIDEISEFLKKIAETIKNQNESKFSDWDSIIKSNLNKDFIDDNDSDSSSSDSDGDDINEDDIENEI